MLHYGHQLVLCLTRVIVETLPCKSKKKTEKVEREGDKNQAESVSSVVSRAWRTMESDPVVFATAVPTITPLGKLKSCLFPLYSSSTKGTDNPSTLN